MSRFFDELEHQLRTAATRDAPVPAPEGRGWWRRPRNAGLIAFAAIGVATPALARVTGLWHPDVTRTTGALTATTSASADCESPGMPPRIRVTDAPVNPKLAKAFGVLRASPTRVDRFPAVGRLGGLLATVNPKTIRSLGTVAGQRYFLVPGTLLDHSAGLSTRCRARVPAKERRREQAARRRSQGITACLLRSNGSGSCAGGPDQLTQGAGPTSSLRRGAPGTVVVALVPNAVTSVTVHYGRSARTFSVHRNFYGYTVALDPPQALPRQITWHLANGATRRER